MPQSIPLPGCCGSLRMCWGGVDSEHSPFLSCAAHSGFQADASLPPCDLSLLGSGVLLIWPHFSLYTQKPSCTLPPIVLIITSPEANRRISYLIHYLLFHSSASFTFTLALSLSPPLNTGHFYKDARLARIPFPPILSGPPLSWPGIYPFIWEQIPFIIKFHLRRPRAPVCDFPAFSWWATSFLPPIANRP